MFAEEAFLRRVHRAAYESWRRRPGGHALFPGYKPPVLPFSMRTVLRREYPGFFGLAFSFTLLASARSLCLPVASTRERSGGSSWAPVRSRISFSGP